jgi:hypothetical protein
VMVSTTRRAPKLVNKEISGLAISSSNYIIFPPRSLGSLTCSQGAGCLAVE